MRVLKINLLFFLTLLLPVILSGMERVSVNSSGVQSNNDSNWPSVSKDGRYIVFQSAANNLVADDTNNQTDVFLRDLDEGTTERISISSASFQANGPSGGPVISADGRYIAFTSDADNLVPADTNNVSDIFLHHRDSDLTTRISVHSSGIQSNANSYRPSISADGRYVAFESAANNLVVGDTNNHIDIFLHDLVSVMTTRISVSSLGTQAGDGGHSPSISADGNYVAFESYSGDLVVGDNNVYSDIFVRDLIHYTTERVSVNNIGIGGNDDSFFAPSISADGRYVAFVSTATNLVDGIISGLWNIYVYDRQLKTIECVSADSNGNHSFFVHTEPFISSDGRYVVFKSTAFDYIDDDTNNARDIYIRNRQNRAIERISVNTVEGNAQSYTPVISSDTHFIVFTSDASNLVADDTNSASDVFIQNNPFSSINPRPILQTRQYGCYDTSGAAVICKNSGQDGDYRSGLLRDIKQTYNFDVIQDFTTGLEWQDDYSDNKGYTTDGSVPFISWTDAKAYCDAIDVGGLTGWHLPTREEWLTLLEYSDSLSAVDPLFFSNNDFYWTVTDYAAAATDVWIINKLFGNVLPASKTGDNKHVICVRGQGFQSSFIKADNVVNDMFMQLQWQDTPAVLSNTHNWDQAINYCQSLTLEHHNNWRLPTITELFSIVDENKHNPAIKHNFIYEQDTAYWSATTYMASKSYAWTLFTADGASGVTPKSVNTYRTRCVRDNSTALPITRTKQDKCYNSSGSEITCLNSGQDGEYQKGLVRQYSRNHILGIVNDLATGLMWQDDYSDAGSIVKRDTWEAAKAYCGNSILAGYSSWRLPTKHELIMLLDRTDSNGAIDSVFQNTSSSCYFWSKNIYAANTQEAFVTYFGDSNVVGKSNKASNWCIRCVRGEENLHGHWSKKSNIVTDHQTDLQWQDTVQTLTTKRWEEALSYCNTLSLNGINDWRLPNINELFSLVDHKRSEPAFPWIFEYQMASNQGEFWSSTSHSYSPNALTIDFYTGEGTRSDKVNYQFTRCVRGTEKAVVFNPSVIMYLLN